MFVIINTNYLITSVFVSKKNKREPLKYLLVRDNSKIVFINVCVYVSMYVCVCACMWCSQTAGCRWLFLSPKGSMYILKASRFEEMIGTSVL